MSRFGGSRRASDLCAGLLLELWADLLAAAPSSEPVLEEEGRRAEGGRGGEGRNRKDELGKEGAGFTFGTSTIKCSWKYCNT